MELIRPGSTRVTAGFRVDGQSIRRYSIGCKRGRGGMDQAGSGEREDLTTFVRLLDLLGDESRANCFLNMNVKPVTGYLSFVDLLFDIH